MKLNSVALLTAFFTISNIQIAHAGCEQIAGVYELVASNCDIPLTGKASGVAALPLPIGIGVKAFLLPKEKLKIEQNTCLEMEFTSIRGDGHSLFLFSTYASDASHPTPLLTRATRWNPINGKFEVIDSRFLVNSVLQDVFKWSFDRANDGDLQIRYFAKTNMINSMTKKADSESQRCVLRRVH